MTDKMVSQSRFILVMCFWGAFIHFLVTMFAPKQGVLRFVFEKTGAALTSSMVSMVYGFNAVMRQCGYTKYIYYRSINSSLWWCWCLLGGVATPHHPLKGVAPSHHRPTQDVALMKDYKNDPI